jgi:CRP-like cAMP-binding protein
MVSVVSTAHPNHRIEVAMIGFEGMTGSGVLLGDDRATNEVIVQSPGSAHRLAVDDLRKAMGQSNTLASLLLRYVQAILIQASQTALANGRGQISERLARWILMWQDRLGNEPLRVTHDFLAVLLGVRRAGVTVALHVLEGKGLIRVMRTQIEIRDRDGLLAIAKGFYGFSEREYTRLISDFSAFSSALVVQQPHAKA